MPLSIRLIDDPVLRKVCVPVEDAFIGQLGSLLDDMHETMTAENGIGLAANQIGHSIRVFIKKTIAGYEEFINPEITAQEELVDFEGEGCLSIPGVSSTTKRYRKVSLKYRDRNGSLLEKNFEDMDAFAVQHEIDHLNGKLYVDQLSPLKREITVKKHKKFLKYGG